MSKKLVDLATRVRRRVRDPEILDLCDEALRVASTRAAQIIAHEKRVLADAEERPNVPHTQQEVAAKFDKTAYMRDYMRKKRAEGEK